MDRCPSCGARVFGNETWCSQCFAPLQPASATAPADERAYVPAGRGYVARPGLATGAFASGEPRPDPAEASGVSGSVAGTVVLAIVLGAAAQAAFYVLARVNALEPETAIRYGLVATMAFYAVVFGLVRSRAVRSSVRWFWTSGSPRAGVAVGAVAGAVGGTLVIAAASAAAGHLTSDAVTSVVIYEGGFARIAAALLIFVVAAPLVEELLFRGLLLESLRARGRRPALMASAFAFAVWHLRPQQLTYYALAGLVLGSLYLSRGLVCSMAAHATFNASILVVALVAALGPFHTVGSPAGLTLRAPATWNTVDTPGPWDTALRGPSGAVLLVQHGDNPGSTFDPDALVAEIRRGGLVPPPELGATLLPETARIELYPVGRVARVGIEVKGHRGELVVLAQPGRQWLVTLVTAGSRRAAHDLDRILATVTLPAPLDPTAAAPPFCGIRPNPAMAPATAQFLQTTIDENQSLTALQAKIEGQGGLAFEDLQARVSIDEQFTAALGGTGFTGRAAHDASTLRSAIGDYDELLMTAEHVSPGSLAGYNGLRAQLAGVRTRRSEAAVRLRSDLGLPASTCTFHTP